MLKPSANLSTLMTSLPLAGRWARAAEAGFAGVEIQFPYEAGLAEIRRLRDMHGLPLVLINAPAGDLMTGGTGLAAHPDRKQAFAAALDTACRWADTLSVPAVNVLAGRLPADTSADCAMDTLCDNLALAAARLADAGARCTFEAINRFDMPGFLVASRADMQAISDRVGHPNLWWQYDTYHMARMGEDVLTDLAAYWPRIGHLQFADTPARGAPGSGDFPFGKLWPLIAQLPYPFYCGAEYRSGDDDLQWMRTLPKIDFHQGN
ncbi:hydroxypyruvate isomerase family protein [Crenobacter intestini]|uniref:Hydroxypyruvate isomerase n=1 Tax=Crenobacter intestini TaxID=2563443 RepID=A0A4T0V5M1_9NEIS|nr:TIM barrel protein [Crenobacter intestini]TIC86889.1 hydroxypyruvate isomerase [Crenobacter intestini]